ncbi:C4-dicarboxylate ABC transporter substrate-binding protein [Synergistales bacterium]|nr:C4-dicarboxylate ABC transporter substrate-binding protein [Synergistales bacterium]
MLAAAWGQVMASKANITLNLETTAGTSENLKLIAAGEANFGLGMVPDTIDAISGLDDFKGKPAGNIRGVAVGLINIFHFVTLDGNGIERLADLKGKNVSVGPSGHPYFGPKVIKAVTGYEGGKDYHPQWMSHDQACEALQNGDIDAIIANSAIPTSAYSALDATVEKTRFLGVNAEDREKVFKGLPGYFITITVPKTAGYTHIKEDFETLGARVMMFTHEDVSEEVIYRLTKFIVENSEESAKIYKPAADFGLDTQKASIPDLKVPLHPGAIKYYKEIGILE